MLKLKSKEDLKDQYLFIDCVEARSLKTCDANGWSDPFCIITLGEKTKIGKTRYIERTLNPRWIQRFQYVGFIDMEHNAYITFTVKDYDAASKNDTIGLVEIPLCDFAQHKWSQKWYRLQPEKEGETTRGWILLRIHLCDKPEDAFKEEFHDKSEDNKHNEQHVHVHANEILVNQATLQNAEKNDGIVDQKDRELEEQKQREEEKRRERRANFFKLDKKDRSPKRKHKHHKRKDELQDDDQDPNTEKNKKDEKEDTNNDNVDSDDISCSSDDIEKP